MLRCLQRQKEQNEGKDAANRSSGSTVSTIRMEELRALNKNALSKEESCARESELQMRRYINPSGLS